MSPINRFKCPALNQDEQPPFSVQIGQGKMVIAEDRLNYMFIASPSLQSF